MGEVRTDCGAETVAAGVTVRCGDRPGHETPHSWERVGTGELEALAAMPPDAGAEEDTRRVVGLMQGSVERGTDEFVEDLRDKARGLR